MEKNVSLSESLKKVHTGVIIYVAVALLGNAIITFGSSAETVAALTSAAMSGDVKEIFRILGGFNLTSFLVNIALLAGLVFYIIGLREFKTHLDSVGQEAIGKVLTGLYVMVAAAVMGMIPLIGLLSGLVSLIGFIIMLLGYGAFRKSTSLNEEGLAGAKKLYNAMIMALVAAIIVIIPLLGTIASFVLYIIYYVFLITGWGAIRKSFSA